MAFSARLAEIRFGCGLSAVARAPGSASAMLDAVRGPDHMANTYKIQPYADFTPLIAQRRALFKQRRNSKGAEVETVNAQIKALRKATSDAQTRWFGQLLARWVHTQDGFRERLTLFWADHFTAVGKSGVTAQSALPYIEEAIRPNVAGSFETLLIAAVTHPVMLSYLDQPSSVGPSSRFARKRDKGEGLNENLAREVLELHTLGVGAPYSQTDVRELARLFTGLSVRKSGTFAFHPGRAEPGTETILERQYGGDPARLAHIHQALVDLARHPATADHIARKLAVHFLSDFPDPALVADLSATYRQTNGNLLAVYDTMLTHPAAWAPELGNVKPPFDFVASACRALGDETVSVFDSNLGRARRHLIHPLAVMGQRWLRPLGPDGWPEPDADWITPQGLSARMRWAMSVPGRVSQTLPDPRQFARTALGPYETPAVTFAAGAAETRAEAIGLVLSSPSFQRR